MRRADLGLQVEGQPLLGAAGEIVQVAAHGPQEALRRARSARDSSADSTPSSTSLRGIVDAVEVFRDPEQRVQVAQAALALLDVGLEQVAAVADR